MAAKEKKALIILGCCLLLFLFFLVVFLLFVWTALRTADQRKSVSDRAVAAQMEKSAVPPESGSAE
jgi:flagellar basal body-associated protein FliL